MSAFAKIIQNARSNPKRIVMSEGEDPRIIEGSVKAFVDGLAIPILVGDSDEIAKVAHEINIDISKIDVIDITQNDMQTNYSAAFFDMRKHKGISEQGAEKAMRDPLMFSAMMVSQGDADGTIGGAVHTTAATVKAAFQVIGRADSVSTVSSFFLMLPGETTTNMNGKEAIVFADCGLVIEPNQKELAEIAIASAHSLQNLLTIEPKVAMLSFSSHGSAKHARVTHIQDATRLAKEQAPDLIIDGELQFDAAFMVHVAESKVPNSPLAGEANVFVFPSLEAGNISYKIAQRLGGMDAIGPILQGLAKPANDLSRGCNADDVYKMLAVTSVQAQ